MSPRRVAHLLHRQLAVADRNRSILVDYVFKKKSAYAIAKATGISREAVRLVLRDHAVDIQGVYEERQENARLAARARQRASAQEKGKKKAARTRAKSPVYHEISNLYRAGATFEDLYARGHCQWVIDRALAFTGTPPRPRGIPRKKELRETVKDLYRKGASPPSLRLFYSAYLVKVAVAEVEAERA